MEGSDDRFGSNTPENDSGDDCDTTLDLGASVRSQALAVTGRSSFSELAATLIIKSLRSRLRTNDADRLKSSYRERYGREPEPLKLVFL